MGLIAQCDCGKRIGVADVMAGRTVRCSACGNEVYVPANSPSKTGKASPTTSAKSSSSRVAVSPTLVTAGIVGGGLAIIVGIFYFGPWRVGSEWAAMSGGANDQATDVVIYALQAYESHRGGYDLSMAHSEPQLQGPASFVPPMMAFPMPRNVMFIGKTNRGNYRGTYDTTTGEVDATIETGGMTVGGLVDVRKARGEFHITGREKNGHPQAELNGKPLAIGGPRIDGLGS